MNFPTVWCCCCYCLFCFDSLEEKRRLKAIWTIFLLLKKIKPLINKIPNEVGRLSELFFLPVLPILLPPRDYPA